MLDVDHERFGVTGDPYAQPNIPIEMWGRTYVIQTSRIFPEMGLGVFACEDIVVPEFQTRFKRWPVDLFPFMGPYYDPSSWRVLSRQCGSFGRYGMHLSHIDRYVDGFS